MNTLKGCVECKHYDECREAYHYENDHILDVIRYRLKNMIYFGDDCFEEQEDE